MGALPNLRPAIPFQTCHPRFNSEVFGARRQDPKGSLAGWATRNWKDLACKGGGRGGRCRLLFGYKT